MDYSKKSRDELIVLCKEKKIKGYHRKNKKEIIQCLIEREEPHAPPPSYAVLSLFTGMGGMDMGFAEQVIVPYQSVSQEDIETLPVPPFVPPLPPGFVPLKRHPFHIVFQNDILPIAKQIAEWNKWAHNYHLRDIRDLLEEKVEFPKADIIIGGFPCQDFSHAGKRRGFGSERGTLYQAYVEVVRRVQPLIFVAENVNGLLTMKGEPIKQIIHDFTEVGYEVAYQLVKCEELGIPQTRWRVIIMGIRQDKRPPLPDQWNRIEISPAIHCPIRPYFAHLEEPDVVDSDPAQTVYSKAARLEKGQGQREIVLDEYAPTMRAEHHGNIEFRRITGGKNKEDHWKERRLTLREAALLQTFPPHCILTHEKRPSSASYKPIGNAVPPLLGYLIAKKVRWILEQL